MLKKLTNYCINKIPSQEEILNYRFVRLLPLSLQNNNFWSVKRKTVANALFIGIVCAYTPLPIQMVEATLLCLIFRANIPIALATTWISNPLTMGPMYYLAYKLGTHLTGDEFGFHPFELSWHWIEHIFIQIWFPLLLGCAIFGLAMGFFAWFLTHFYWRKKLLTQRLQKYQNFHK